MDKSTAPAGTRNAFCIFIDTLCEGRVPLVTDGGGRYVVFDTELEAQKEIADDAMTRLQQFMDGERDFDDAITVEEYILPVTVHPDGSFTDEAGKTHGPKAS
jgi:hypothetical protein